MEQLPDELPQNWPEIFDELKRKEGLASDAKLASLLAVTRGYICAVRKDRKGVSKEFATKVLLKLGKRYEPADLERLLVPSRIRRYTYDLAAAISLVMQRARGHCELCGLAAPFNRPDGGPYLELHTVQGQSKDLTKSTHRMVALCPNCHRKIEIAPTCEDQNLLQKIVDNFTIPPPREVPQRNCPGMKKPWRE
jgi:Zn finger protein HypA/HybF involved in hydrogenase expression